MWVPDDPSLLSSPAGANGVFLAALGNRLHGAVLRPSDGGGREEEEDTSQGRAQGWDVLEF